MSSIFGMEKGAKGDSKREKNMVPLRNSVAANFSKKKSDTRTHAAASSDHKHIIFLSLKSSC
jgi:hypothetical protein